VLVSLPCFDYCIGLTWSLTDSSSSRSSSSEPAAQSAADASPLVALVGKGVCFDTGGSDLKTAQGMKLMKRVGHSAFCCVIEPAFTVLLLMLFDRAG
jgi:leucyl aminopeptidase